MLDHTKGDSDCHRGAQSDSAIRTHQNSHNVPWYRQGNRKRRYSEMEALCSLPTACIETLYQSNHHRSRSVSEVARQAVCSQEAEDRECWHPVSYSSPPHLRGLGSGPQKHLWRGQDTGSSGDTPDLSDLSSVLKPWHTSWMPVTLTLWTPGNAKGQF